MLLQVLYPANEVCKIVCFCLRSVQTNVQVPLVIAHYALYNKDLLRLQAKIIKAAIGRLSGKLSFPSKSINHLVPILRATLAAKYFFIQTAPGRSNAFFAVQGQLGYFCRLKSKFYQQTDMILVFAKFTA